MRFANSNKFSPIGIDLGSHSFKAVQLKRVGATWGISSTISLPRIDPSVPFNGGEIGRLSGVLDRRGFAGQDVILAIPAANLLTSILELPARAPGVPLEQIAAIEFARVHKQEAANVTMSTWELPAPARAGKATYMLAIGAVSQKLESHIDLIESQGLNVVAIDEPFTAAARAALYLSAPAAGLTSVIDLGWDAARLTIVMASQVIYTRKLVDAGLLRLFNKIQETTSTLGESSQQMIWQFGLIPHPQASPEQAEIFDAVEDHFAGVIREISQAFSYAIHRYADTTMSASILIGGGATIPGIASEFEKGTGIPTSIPASSTGIETPGLTSSLGLALSSEALR